MIHALEPIMRDALGRLADQIRTGLPPFLAALAILLLTYLLARFARWVVIRVFKGIEMDQWLRRSGFSSMIDRSGTLRTSRVVAQSVWWGILIAGCLAALNVFGTQFTGRLVEGLVLLFPRLLAGAAIILAGLWLGQYLGRGMLVWAVNEDLPSPRRLAAAVRVLVVFAAVVVAAETINFAANVFLAAFILILGGVVLAAGLALGLGCREAVRRHLEERAPEEDERSLWNHL